MQKFDNKIGTHIVCIGEFDWQLKFNQYFEANKIAQKLLGGDKDRQVCTMALHWAGYMTGYWENPNNKVCAIIISERYPNFSREDFHAVILDQVEEIKTYTE